MSHQPLPEGADGGRELTELLRQLSRAAGPSGCEGRAARLMLEKLTPLADRTMIDPLGSVAAFRKAGVKKPPGKKVLVAAHLDEIGLLITGVDTGGYLRFTQIGGFDARVLLGQEVLVLSGSGRELSGIIGAKPPHYQSPAEQECVLPMHDLYIDIGLSERRARSLVSPGDTATLRGPLAELQGGRVSGKAMDDRACLAAMVRTMELLGTMRRPWDVYAVATAQEEAGLGYLGAVTSAFRIRPDLALVLDVTHADMPLAPEHKTFALSRGPVIAVGPNIHPAVSQRLIQTARRLEMPFQVEPLAGNSGTDAVDIQVAGSGIPTGLLGVPVRYMHTPVETASLADIERLARLLAAFVSELDTLDLSWRD